jgi:hypothetical protein
MNTQLNIKSRQLRFSPTFVTLLIGAVMVLVLGGRSIQAQTTTTTTDQTATSSTNQTKLATTDPNAPVDSSITLAVRGSVSDPNGSISVTGNVIISARRVIDTTSTTAASIVLLDFDFSQVKGTSGSTKTTLTTYVTGDNLASEIRPLQDTDTVIVTVPYYDTAKGALSARTMLATATLKFDVSTGKLASGSISVGNNVVTSSAVGTTAPVAIQ